MIKEGRGNLLQAEAAALVNTVKRGAHLGYGGRRAGESILCPFHGYRIGVGGESDDGLCVRGYETLASGGSLFVRLSSHSRPDLPRALADFDHGHTYVPGFSMAARTSILLRPLPGL